MKHPSLRLHLLPVLLLSLVLGSCERSKPRYRIGVSQCSDDAWRRQMNAEMQREATFSKDISLDIRCAHDDRVRQAAQIDSLLAEGVDLLIVSPSEEVALTPAVEAASRQGVPVVLVDRRVKTDAYTAFVGADNRAIGRDAATFMAARLSGRGSVAEFAAPLASTAGSERHQGFVEGLKRTPGMHLMATVMTTWEGERIDRQVDSLVRAGQVPDFAFACNDRVGVKVHDAFKRLGHEVPVVGVDGLTSPGGGLEMVEKGRLAASLIYPTGGDKALILAQRILQGQPYKRETVLHSAVISSLTARIFRMQADEVNERTARIDSLNQQIDRFLSRSSLQNMLLVALCIIIVLIGVVLAVGLRAYFATIRHNDELAQQKHKLEEQRDQLVQLSKELEESTQSKLTFFTEVSHDLRTPLTLIQAPVEQLLKLLPPDSKEGELLDIIHTNADILLRLVGQTLDFRKFEDGQLQLHAAEVDLQAELQRWCAPFRTLAQKKMVRFRVEAEGAGPFRAAVDREKMESVLYNLLSNAFKFTPEGGRITVSLCTTDDAERGRCAIIRVSDSGLGIDADKISHVFDRFYQADVSHDGSGIGLATVKAYVELHGGVVSAQSTPGRGTVFTVVVPCVQHDAAALASQRLALTAEGQASDVPSAPATPSEAAPQEADPAIDGRKAEGENAPSLPSGLPSGQKDASSLSADGTPPLVLVIDDNADIRAYLRILLGADYRMEEATNGKEGLAKALQLMPDAVVCDVMMPVMDGWECCRRLKDEWQTSHIPVMMLTACALDEQRIAGFDCGADAYISKPFSPDLFRSRLRNLIANHRRLQTFFADKATLAKADVSELDKGFAERFRALIDQRMHESELSVEDLAADMGLGRSQLYRKVKALTGNSPVELLRQARLKRAAELLTRTEKAVGEVAYEVGFSSPGYLTKCFREYFGVSPTDYAARK